MLDRKKIVKVLRESPTTSKPNATVASGCKSIILLVLFTLHQTPRS